MDDVGGDAFIAPHEQVHFPRADEGIGPYGDIDRCASQGRAALARQTGYDPAGDRKGRPYKLPFTTDKGLTP